MSFINQFFNDHGSVLTEKLEENGFSIDQAKDFLGETASSLTSSTEGTDIADTLSNLAGDPAQLMSSINIDDIAQRLSIDPGQVQTGIDAITPILSQQLSQSTGGIVGSISALAGGSVGGLFSSAKKLFS